MGVAVCVRMAALGTALVLAGPAGATPEEIAVEASFEAIQQAVEVRNLPALSRLVHPGFEMLHGLGQIENRTTWLALVARGNLPRQQSGRREFEQAITTIVGTTALRSSIVRFRDTKLRRDLWLRGTATFAKVGDTWVQVRQQSTALHDGPMTDARSLADFAGVFAIPGRERFTIEPAADYLRLRWASGATLPLVPAGPDEFGAGPFSTVTFARERNGRIVTATRSGPEGNWWTAARLADPDL